MKLIRADRVAVVLFVVALAAVATAPAADPPTRLVAALPADAPAAVKPPARYKFPMDRRLDVEPKPIASDPTVKYDYDIVYVRAPRFIKSRDGKERPSAWPEIGHPTHIDPGYDLVVLHPDGSEDVLVEGGKGSVTDPYVSFDGQSVYYALHHDPKAGDWSAGADLYKVHVKTKQITRLTRQEPTPNTGVADWAADFRTPGKGKAVVPHGVYNICPCPLPGGRLAFVSNRDSVRTPRGYPTYALQLFVMDEDGANVEKIGHLNVAGALHPVILADGRIIFSSLESQGIRGGIQWGIWWIRPDGTHWNPVISAFLGGGASDAFHFQTQLSDRNLVVELYYNQNTAGFGAHFKVPAGPADGYPAFRPADPAANPNPENTFLLGGPIGGTGPRVFPFMPIGTETITRFTTGSDQTSLTADRKDKSSPRVGKVSHPCGAPDNHLLTVWTPGSGPSGGGFEGGPPTDAGIYLIKNGQPIDEPGQMLLIKNDPKFNEQWPRPLVPYKRVYGVEEPANLAPLSNDGSLSPHLPAGTPYGLVGASSLYKRESFPNGRVPEGSVTATGHPYAALGDSWKGTNWSGQGADAGLYDNADIHAIRILAMEPATTVVANQFYDKAKERLRILGEIPVRKFDAGREPRDPDNNPDTSFLAKIPADTPFTFQTLDKDGMVLNMAQTWHQVRPGEVRTDCGGCHAHSQKPTEFSQTAASRSDYKLFDLTRRTPLITDKDHDESKLTWDAKNETGLRYEPSMKNVEYFRDVKPILARSCVACHRHDMDKPAGNLILDPDLDLNNAKTFHERFDGVAHTIAMSGMKSAKGNVPFMLDPRWVRDFQSRRSPLVWTLFGRRLDGLPAKAPKGMEAEHKKVLEAGDYKQGTLMPPQDAVGGTYVGPPDGKPVKVAPLSDEDRRTLVRWVDLGCPIDWAYDAAHPQQAGNGWLLDDQRPTLTVTTPRAGRNAGLPQILIGMTDHESGLDLETLLVVLGAPVGKFAANENLAPQFKQVSPGVWALALKDPPKALAKTTLTVSVKDRQGNVTRVERTFSVGD